MRYVHDCAFCGWRRSGESETMLEPRCEACGSCLRPVPEEEIDGLVASEELGDPRPPSKSADVTGPFALMVSIPLLVPYLGIHLGPFIFGVPMVVLIFSAVRAAAACKRASPGTDLRVWRLLVGASGLAALASGVAMVTLQLGLGVIAYYVGAAASVAILVAAFVLAMDRLRGVRLERVVDAVLLGMVLVAISSYFVILPGVEKGDVALTLTFAVDVLALLLTSVAAIARSDRRARRVSWALAATFGLAAVGDGLVAATAAGSIHTGPAATALLWALAGAALAWAADEQLSSSTETPAGAQESAGRGWVLARVVLPLLAVLSFPAMAGALWIAHRGLDLQAALLFGGSFVLALIVAFGRQAYLLVDNRRAVLRERRLRGEALRRTEQLEALTGLATTMTQTLEEAPIVEQALTVLHLAARGSSSALHVHEDDALVLRATSGRWHEEHAWADRPFDGTRVHVRGARQIVRMPIAARGHDIGVVTLIRPLDDPVTDDELELLELLVDELAVAVQNARDYREKLEQAIRDPLTGIYNRRFLFEAFEKEVQRTERYGSDVSLVLFDVDNFKLVNDTRGHAAGDDVLRKLAALVDSLIRPVDSFARIGGEEFALLLPETKQLDALLVAERVRASVSRAQLLPDRRVTVSAGVASCPHDATTRDELHRKADAALYWAKRNGKDLCALAREAPSEGAEEAHHAIAHLYALVGLIDAQLRTRDHSESVASYAVAIGQRLGLSGDRILALRRAAFLHDIGKIGVRPEILLKPDRLTDEEFEEVKAHSELGARILRQASLHEEAGWVLAHHERVDGRGYPHGLSGDQIPLEARILFVADSFEAMTSDRPYQRGRETAEALAELRRCSGTQFDADVVDALVALIEAGTLAVLAVRHDEQAAQTA